jgi:hypothetical protein
MDLKSLLWYGVLTSITAAYLVALAACDPPNSMRCRIIPDG